MNKAQILERIIEISAEIYIILLSGDNSLPVAARWARLQRERSYLKAVYSDLEK